jgi:hypothetical protein
LTAIVPAEAVLRNRFDGRGKLSEIFRQRIPTRPKLRNHVALKASYFQERLG